MVSNCITIAVDYTLLTFTAICHVVLANCLQPTKKHLVHRFHKESVSKDVFVHSKHEREPTKRYKQDYVLECQTVIQESH